MLRNTSTLGDRTGNLPVTSSPALPPEPHAAVCCVIRFVRTAASTPPSSSVAGWDEKRGGKRPPEIDSCGAMLIATSVSCDFEIDLKERKNTCSATVQEDAFRSAGCVPTGQSPASRPPPSPVTQCLGRGAPVVLSGNLGDEAFICKSRCYPSPPHRPAEDPERKRVPARPSR